MGIWKVELLYSLFGKMESLSVTESLRWPVCHFLLCQWAINLLGPDKNFVHIVYGNQQSKSVGSVDSHWNCMYKNELIDTDTTEQVVEIE